MWRLKHPACRVQIWSNIKNSTSVVYSQVRLNILVFYFKILVVLLLFDSRKYLTSTVWELMPNSCADKPGSLNSAKDSLYFRFWNLSVYSSMHGDLFPPPCRCIVGRAMYLLTGSRAHRSWDLSKGVWLTSQLVYLQAVKVSRRPVWMQMFSKVAAYWLCRHLCMSC